MQRGTAMVLSAAFLWGTTFPAVRFGLDSGGLNPFGFLYFRFALATLALAVIGIALRRIRFELFGDWRLWGIAAFNTLGYALQFLGQDLTTATKTSLLVNVNVLVTVVLAWFVLQERFGRLTIAAIVVGFVGIFLLSTSGDLRALRLSNEEFVGDLMAFGTGVCWSVIILWVKAYLNRHPDTDAVAMNMVVFSVTTVIAFPLALMEGGLSYTGNVAGVATIAYLGLFSTTLAFLLWQEGLRAIPASMSAVLLLFETVVAMVLSVSFLGERLTGWSALGAVLVLAAMFLASRPVRPVKVATGSEAPLAPQDPRP